MANPYYPAGVADLPWDEPESDDDHVDDPSPDDVDDYYAQAVQP